MVPSAFVQLSRIPLPINGKLDRRALPLPDRESLIQLGHEEPIGAVEQALAQAWEAILKVGGIERGDSFSELGGHSLLLPTQVSQLARQGLKLNLVDVFKHPVLMDMAKHIGASRGDASIESDEARGIRTTGSQAPLFLFHEHTGFDFYFPRLTAHLDSDVPVYGLAGVPLHMPQIQSMQAVAKRMVSLIRKVQPEAPYRLAGWSFGGALAYETAIRLSSMGEEIAFLGLIETYHPRALGLNASQLARRSESERLVALCNDVVSQAANDFDDIFARCRDAGILPDYLDGFEAHDVRRYLQRCHAHDLALAGHEPLQAPFPVHMFAARRRPQGETQDTQSEMLGWHGCLPETGRRFTWVSGDHQSLLDAESRNWAKPCRMRCLARQRCHEERQGGHRLRCDSAGRIERHGGNRSVVPATITS